MAVTKSLKVDPEFGNRFFSAWMRSKYREYNQNELSKVFDVSAQSVSSWVNSKRYPYIDTGIQIAREFHITLDWLYVGREPRIPKDHTPFDTITYRLVSLNKHQLDPLITLLSMIEKEQITPRQLEEFIMACIRQE